MVLILIFVLITTQFLVRALLLFTQIKFYPRWRVLYKHIHFVLLVALTLLFIICYKTIIYYMDYNINCQINPLIKNDDGVISSIKKEYPNFAQSLVNNWKWFYTGTSDGLTYFVMMANLLFIIMTTVHQ